MVQPIPGVGPPGYADASAPRFYSDDPRNTGNSIFRRFSSEYETETKLNSIRHFFQLVLLLFEVGSFSTNHKRHGKKIAEQEF